MVGGLNPIPLLPPLKAPLGLDATLLMLLLDGPKAFGCLGSPRKLSLSEEMEENGPFDRVADENPTGITDPTCGVLSNLDLPLRDGRLSGLLGTGYW